MTLSRFLRDYLYIPLGGNRHGPLRRHTNLFATMVLGGLWHGAGWNFVIWGALHGGFLIVNHAWRDVCRRLRLSFSPSLGRFFATGLTFVCVVIAWVYFRAPDLATANRVVSGMLGAFGLALPEAVAARLGPLWPVLQESGVRAFVGGDALFAETWAWVFIGAGVAFLCPNTQEIMRRYLPAAFYGASLAEREPARIEWAPRRRDAIMVGLLFALGVLALSRPTEFLYFQF